MACAESKATAKVESGWLYHDGDEGAIQIGDSRSATRTGIGGCSSAKPSTMRGQDGGTFTGRGEEWHGQLYWYDFKRLGAALKEKYLDWICTVRNGFALREEKAHSYQTRQHPSGVSDSRTSICNIVICAGVDAVLRIDAADVV